MLARLAKSLALLLAGLLLLLLIAALAGLLYLRPASGPVAMDAHHPFRSPEAQAAFLSLYDRHAERWPVESHTRMVTTAYGDTLVRSSGPPTAPDLVLLHGGRGNSLQWLPNIETLSRHFRVHTVDIIGDFGRSIYSRRLDDAQDYVDWLDELSANLDLSSGFNLLGVSYGGWIATHYAAHAPERIQRLLLVAPAGIGTSLRPPRSPRAAACLIPVERFTRRCLTWLFPDLAASGPQGEALLADWAEMFTVALRSFKATPLLYPAPLDEAAWQRLRMPVLYLVGENEVLFDPAAAMDTLAARLPRLETVVIAEAGHGVTASQAERFNQAVIDFLK